MSAEVERLIVMRQRFNLPRRYVSWRIGVHPSTIFRWEKGYTSPSFLSRKALASMLAKYPGERARSGGALC
jgi:DNA-binding transcriptional regulator YiaG